MTLRQRLSVTGLQVAQGFIFRILRNEPTLIPSASINHENKSKDTIKLVFKLLSCRIEAYDLYLKLCVSSLTSWQPSREFTSWAFWQERMEPAKVSITHTAERSMKKVICERPKQRTWLLGEARRENGLAAKNAFSWSNDYTSDMYVF